MQQDKQNEDFSLSKQKISYSEYLSPLCPIEPSDCALRTFNPIRSIVDWLKLPSTPPPNKHLISLALGDPTAYAQRECRSENAFKILPHSATIEAVEKALKESVGYPPAIGSELARKAIAQHANHHFGKKFYTVEDVIVTSGCSGALEMCITALGSGGKHNILIPRPGFSLYAVIAKCRDIEVRYYDLEPSSNWQINLSQLKELIDDKTCAILLNNPSNPCGSVWAREHIIDCMLLAHKYRLVVIADEIYEDMVFEGSKYVPMAKVVEEQGLDVPVLTCGGIAKRYLVPGWRLGWILINHNPRFSKLRKSFVDLAGLILGANSSVQAALSDIFTKTPPHFYKDFNAYLQSNAELLYHELITKVPKVKPIKPQGTLYMMVDISAVNTDDRKFCQDLLTEEMVSCLPGSIFGMNGYVRLVFAAPPETLKEAVQRLVQFIANSNNKKL